MSKNNTGTGKICFVSSSGGHWEELQQLQQLAEKHPCFYVTEQGGQTLGWKKHKLYTLPQINRREKYFAVHFLRLFVKAAKILRKENPDVVITTGALVSFPFCFWGKLHGCKVIYIESICRSENLSLTGRILYLFADLFLVQWKELQRKYKKAVYAGSLF